MQCPRSNLSVDFEIFHDVERSTAISDPVNDEIRQGEHQTAGGLILATDVGHAHRIRDIFTKHHLPPPQIVTHKEDQASTLIDGFKVSGDKWIIAVQMISEGVDIPRLRVCVYATTVMTELRFRQAVGRIVRTVPGLSEQTAYFYISADPTHVQYALDIQKERDHALNDVENVLQPAGNGSGDRQSIFTPVMSTADAHGTVLIGDIVSVQEIDEVKRVLERMPGPAFPPGSPLEPLVHFYRAVRATEGASSDGTSPKEAPRPPEPPLYVQRTALRRACQREVGQLVKLQRACRGDDPNTPSGEEFQAIFVHLSERDGGTQANLSVDQLRARLQYLIQWRQQLEARARSTKTPA